MEYGKHVDKKRMKEEKRKDHNTPCAQMDTYHPNTRSEDHPPQPQENWQEVRTTGDGHPNSGTKVHHLPHTQILTPGTEMRAGLQDLYRPH